MSVRFAGFLPGVDAFDAALFRRAQVAFHGTQHQQVVLRRSGCIPVPAPAHTHHLLPPCRLSHAEASCMDPQSRILLEQAHLALVDAGARRGAAVPAHTGV